MSQFASDSICPHCGSTTIARCASTGECRCADSVLGCGYTWMPTPPFVPEVELASFLTNSELLTDADGYTVLPTAIHVDNALELLWLVAQQADHIVNRYSPIGTSNEYTEDLRKLMIHLEQLITAFGFQPLRVDTRGLILSWVRDEVLAPYEAAMGSSTSKRAGKYLDQYLVEALHRLKREDPRPEDDHA